MIVQPSALSSQLSAGTALFDAKRAKERIYRQRMISNKLQETAFADSLLLRAEGLRK